MALCHLCTVSSRVTIVLQLLAVAKSEGPDKKYMPAKSQQDKFGVENVSQDQKSLRKQLLLYWVYSVYSKSIY